MELSEGAFSESLSFFPVTPSPFCKYSTVSEPDEEGPTIGRVKVEHFQDGSVKLNGLPEIVESIK